MRKVIGWVVVLVLSFSSGVYAQESSSYMDEAPPTAKPARTAENIAAGKEIYIKRCLPCHGADGASSGPAAEFLDPRPRDFTRGILKIKTTLLDQPPTDEDHFRIITRGIPGTAMPMWQGILSEEQRWQVAFYEQTFFENIKGNPEAVRTGITIGAEPPSTPESIKKGDELFHGKATCFVCHGKDGRGDGPIAVTLRDIWGNPVRPRNLTKSWLYKGGNTTKQIFTRVTTGIFASGMPTFEDKLTEEERWNIAHYVKSIQKELHGLTNTVIKPKQVEKISLDPNDPMWQGVDYIDIPLTGQVTMPPRLQTPSVDVITVRAVYTDKEVAFQLDWDDIRADTLPEETPESIAAAFAEEVAAAIAAGEEPPLPPTPPPPPPAPGSPEYTTYPRLYPSEIRPQGPFPDAAAIQMSVAIPDSPELPHFIMGSSSKPVNLWNWKADWNDNPERKTPVQLLLAKGPKETPAVLKSESMVGKGAFADGKWKVVIKRPLASDDPKSVTPIGPGVMIPVSFHVWDGLNGEVGLRHSLSSWYFFLIDPTTPKSVYGYSIGAFVLAIGLEFFFIKKAREWKKV